MPEYNIPRHGKSGKIILGVSAEEAAPAIASIFIGFVFGRLVWGGLPFTAGCIIVGVAISRGYHDIKRRAVPGYLRSKLFSWGFYKYNDTFNKPNVIYVGKTVGINNKEKAKAKTK